MRLGLTAPCSVKANGGLRMPPHELDVPDWNIKLAEASRVDTPFDLELVEVSRIMQCSDLECAKFAKCARGFGIYVENGHVQQGHPTRGDGVPDPCAGRRLRRVRRRR